MLSYKTAGAISLLLAFLISMAVVAVLFMSLATGIWFYTTQVLQREKILISERLPELDATYQLAAVTAGLQSTGLLLISSQTSDNLENRRRELDATITKTRLSITALENLNRSERRRLEAAVDDLSTLTGKLVDLKARQFELGQRVQKQKAQALSVLEKLERPVKQQVIRLTDQLLAISEQMSGVRSSEIAGENGARLIAESARKFETTNLTIQDYLLFSQDIGALSAVIDRLSLLTSSESLSQSRQSRDLLMRALVNRSIYIEGGASSRSLLEGLRDLNNMLARKDNLFELQELIIRQNVDLASLGNLLAIPNESILSKIDQLRLASSTSVSTEAEQTLAGLYKYRSFLLAISVITILVLALISYWLLYRATVVPLIGITKQLDDVGSDNFPAQAKHYFFKELTTLSLAMSQLDQAQKLMQVNDVYLQQANADLLHANLELEQFAHVASHDLQEPLRKLQQFSDLLDEDYGRQLDADGKYFVESIRSSARRMSQLISDTLAYSRAGSGEQKLEAVDLSDLLLQLRDEIDVAITDVQGVLVIDKLPVVLANSLGMAQLFRNLMTNAFKYRRPGIPARVSIKATESTQVGNAAIVIRVQDNGVGIEEQYLERIFKPFERLQTDGVRGTGLGLAICRKVCESHGWGIDVSSTLGFGTCFEISIPKGSLWDQSRDAA